LNGFEPARRSEPSPPDVPRSALLHRCEVLEAASVGYNALEGVVALGAGVAAGSVALWGFGFDSLVEVTSATVLWWRLRLERRGSARGTEEEVERRAAKGADALLLLLTLAILAEAGRQLATRSRPDPSLVGMFLTGLSLLVMPFLARAKLKMAARFGSRAMRADAHEAVTCAWLSGTTLSSLVLIATRGWWWADPAAAVLMVPLIAREGWEAWQGGDAAAVSEQEEPE